MMRKCLVLIGMVVGPWVDSASAQALDKVFLGSLHSHTSYSDGSGKPREAYKAAREAGLDFFAITEHNHRQCEEGATGSRKDGILIGKDHELYSGSDADSLIRSAQDLTEDGRFVALYGQEYSSISKGNHVNVFDVGEVIDDRDVPNGRFDKLVDWLASHEASNGKPAMIQFGSWAQISGLTP
jgi:PHP domain-containing protein